MSAFLAVSDELIAGKTNEDRLIVRFGVIKVICRPLLNLIRLHYRVRFALLARVHGG